MNVSVVLFTSFVFLLIMGVPVAASLTFASFIYLYEVGTLRLADFHQ